MDIEPNIISHEMLETAIKNQSKQGELDFSSVLKIRLEFQNILKIDHLWMLKNLTKLSLNYNKIDTIENLDPLTQLKELDLSFNYIEKIQNLDPLINLEVLSLFSNRIEAIENMNNLNKVIILNLGANRIKSMSGFERLRFLPIKVFNMERNPIGEKIDIREYVSAFLPKVKYYNYTYVTGQEKEQAAKEYSLELRELNEREYKEICEVQEQHRLNEEAKHYQHCFVENLDGHQLFEKLFADAHYTNGFTGMEEIKRKLQDEMFSLTQHIFQIGLNRYEEREKEVRSFKICLITAKNLNQRKGQKIINDLMRNKQLKRASEIEGLIDETWKMLMGMEVQLFEDIEDVTKTFGHILSDLVNDFVKDVQSVFVQIGELIDHLYDVEKDHSSARGEMAQKLWKYQKKVLNNREYLLQERAREYESNLLKSFKEGEIERNRRKIIEINMFLDTMRVGLTEVLSSTGRSVS